MPIESFESTPIFEVHGQEWTWGDALEGAERRGELHGALAMAREGLAWQHLGDPPEEAWKAEARSFRVEHGLGAARDMLLWLAAVGLDANLWMDALARRLLAGRTIPPDAPAPSPRELRLALRADLAVAGGLAPLARGLASRVAVAAQRGPLPTMEAGLGARAEAVERAWEARAEEVASPGAIEANLRASRADWILVQLVLATFPTLDGAREAVWCVREDGQSLAAVASEARAPVYGRRARLRELDADLRGALLGARPGELVGPLERPDGFCVVSLTEKRLPEAADPETRAALREQLMRPVAAAAVEGLLTWRMRL